MRSLLVAVLFGVASCAYAGQAAPGGGLDQASTVAQKSGDEKPLPADLELRDGKGNAVHLAGFAGTPIVLNFWATWCPPCKHELPWLVAIQNKFGSQGLKVVGVSLDEADDPGVAKVLAGAGVNYTILFGSLDSLSRLGADGLPLTFYVGKDGKVRRKVLGIASYEELEKNVEELLADRDPEQKSQQAARQ